MADCGPPSSYNRRERPLLRTALGLGSDEASWLDIKSDVQKVKNEVDLGHSLGDFLCFFWAIFFFGKKQKNGGNVVWASTTNLEAECFGNQLEPLRNEHHEP